MTTGNGTLARLAYPAAHAGSAVLPFRGRLARPDTRFGDFRQF